MVPEELDELHLDDPDPDQPDIGEDIEHDDEIPDELDVEDLDDLLVGVDPDDIEEPDDGAQ